MKSVNLKEFQAHLHKYITPKEDLVVTIRGKETFVVTFKVVTSNNSNDKVVTSKQKAISTLKQKIKITEDKSIKPETPEEEIHYCLACSKLGRRREAVDLVDVYEDGQERKIWLCGVCKSKYSVCV